jgi:rod shape-determining protein MreB
MKVAGDKMNKDIIDYIKDVFKLSIGEKTAEEIKISSSSVLKNRKFKHKARGKDLVTGLPNEVEITSDNVREAIAHSISTIVTGVRDVIESSPPEIISDVYEQGIYITGGGAEIDGLAELIADHLGVNVTIVSDPLTAVIRGELKVLEDLENYKELLLKNVNEMPLIM